MMTMRLVWCVLVASLLGAPAWAQEDPPPSPSPPGSQQWHTGEPVSMAVAMAGVVLSSAGFGLMLRTTGPCYCEPRTAWVVGGVAVVAAGLTMTWLGLRSRTVTIAPTVERHALGGTATIRWGGAAHIGARWTGLMAGFTPAPTDRTSTGTFDQGGPSLDIREP